MIGVVGGYVFIAVISGLGAVVAFLWEVIRDGDGGGIIAAFVLGGICLLTMSMAAEYAATLS